MRQEILDLLVATEVVVPIVVRLVLLQTAPVIKQSLHGHHTLPEWSLARTLHGHSYFNPTTTALADS